MAFLTEGYQTLIAFSQLPNVPFRERTVTPPQLDAAGLIDVTTMRSQILRQKQPKKLLDTSTMSCEIQWDPVVYSTVGDVTKRVLGKVGGSQIEFPDGSQISFYGWIASFKPAALKEGEFASATIDVVCSHQDANGVLQTITYTKPADVINHLPGWANVPG